MMLLCYIIDNVSTNSLAFHDFLLLAFYGSVKAVSTSEMLGGVLALCTAILCRDIPSFVFEALCQCSCSKRCKQDFEDTETKSSQCTQHPNDNYVEFSYYIYSINC